MKNLYFFQKAQCYQRNRKHTLKHDFVVFVVVVVKTVTLFHWKRFDMIFIKITSSMKIITFKILAVNFWLYTVVYKVVSVFLELVASFFNIYVVSVF